MRRKEAEDMGRQTIRRSRNSTGSFKRDLNLWAKDLATLSSIHGVIWYNRTDNPFIKLSILVTTLCLIIALPVYIVIEMVDFYHNPAFINTIIWDHTYPETYPNITVCHSRYFDTNKLRRHNISDGLANYMTLVLDITFPEYNFQMTSSADEALRQTYVKMMDMYAIELDQILTSHDLDLYELFKKVAISCDDFVLYCEIHRKIYMTTDFAGKSANSQSPTCCEAIFNTEPLFSQAGTCYTTNVKITESLAHILSNVRMWLDLKYDRTPNYSVILKGSDGADRRGGYVAVSYDDVPGTILITNPSKIMAGTSSVIALSKHENDRRGLNRKNVTCFEKHNQTFSETFGVEQTYLNCRGLLTHYAFPGCTVGPFFGYPALPGSPICTPKMMLNTGTQNTTDYANFLSLFPQCLYDCNRISSDFEHSFSSLDLTAMKEYLQHSEMMLNSSINVAKPEEIMSLVFFFKSFDYSINQMSRETFFDFLSKAGGTMGLVIGASIFSFIEAFFFFFYLLRIVFKNSVL